MLMFLCVSLAHAANPPVEKAAPEVQAKAPGTIVFESHRALVELLVDGSKYAQLWHPGEARFEVPAGPHELRVYSSGEPTDLPTVIAPGATLRVLVGRTGVSLETELAAADDEPAGPVPVEFRSVGGSAQLRLGRDRVLLGAGERVMVDLVPGDHAFSVRSRDGTVIWANGMLEVGRAPGLVVQVSDGRLPELVGPGQFHTGG